jgi:hypothetical protein
VIGAALPSLIKDDARWQHSYCLSHPGLLSRRSKGAVFSAVTFHPLPPLLLLLLVLLVLLLLLQGQQALLLPGLGCVGQGPQDPLAARAAPV